MHCILCKVLIWLDISFNHRCHICSLILQYDFIYIINIIFFRLGWLGLGCSPGLDPFGRWRKVRRRKRKKTRKLNKRQLAASALASLYRLLNAYQFRKAWFKSKLSSFSLISWLRFKIFIRKNLKVNRWNC